MDKEVEKALERARDEEKKIIPTMEELKEEDKEFLEEAKKASRIIKEESN